MGLNSWTVCAAVPSPVKLTVVRNTWMQTKAETAPELSVTSLKLMWLMPEATGHGWWTKRESQLQSFLSPPPGCVLPGLKRRVEGYCPAGSAAVGARSICNWVFPLCVSPLRRNSLGPQERLFLGKHLNCSGKKKSRKPPAISFQEWLVGLKVPGWLESLGRGFESRRPRLDNRFRLGLSK